MKIFTTKSQNLLAKYKHYLGRLVNFTELLVYKADNTKTYI